MGMVYSDESSIDPIFTNLVNVLITASASGGFEDPEDVTQLKQILALGLKLNLITNSLDERLQKSLQGAVSGEKPLTDEDALEIILALERIRDYVTLTQPKSNLYLSFANSSGEKDSPRINSSSRYPLQSQGNIDKAVSNVAARAAPAIHDLREMIEAAIVDNETKERFRKQLNEYEKISEEAAKGALEQQKQAFELKLLQQKVSFEQDIETRRKELALKEAETKTQRIVRLLDRDLVSVIIGGILLIILGVAMVVLIARGTVSSDLLETAFLILLGFFFGSAVPAARAASTKSDNQSST